MLSHAVYVLKYLYRGYAGVNYLRIRGKKNRRETEYFISVLRHTERITTIFITLFYSYYEVSGLLAAFLGEPGYNREVQFFRLSPVTPIGNAWIIYKLWDVKVIIADQSYLK
ncbi:hypothetical protein ACJX0J_029691 [Zea mays]